MIATRIISNYYINTRGNAVIEKDKMLDFARLYDNVPLHVKVVIKIQFQRN